MRATFNLIKKMTCCWPDDNTLFSVSSVASVTSGDFVLCVKMVIRQGKLSIPNK